MDVLTQDVYNFLKVEMKFETANQFLASATATVASQYELWREAQGKPSLRQDAKSVVYTWKQEVTRRIRAKDASRATKTTETASSNNDGAASTTTTISNSNGSHSHAPSGVPPPPSRMLSLPMTLKKQQRQSQKYGPSIKKYVMLDENLVDSSPSNRDNYSSNSNNSNKKKKKDSEKNNLFEMQVDGEIIKPLDNDGTLTWQHLLMLLLVRFYSVSLTINLHQNHTQT
jgi:hypothetical protein